MSEKIIVAVSGGPDSMALLDMLRKKEYDCIVAHVNYGLRDSAYRDEKIVEDYCRQYNLTFELLNNKKVSTENFQAFAREIRYDFLVNLSNKYDTPNVYVAHHKDDVIETYIMQKKRKITPKFYGIKEKVSFRTINIIRPLLAYSKEDLVNYCLSNNLEYGVDESNLSDTYLRNKIRHEIEDKMTESDKMEIIQEINVKNQELFKRQSITKANYNNFILNYQSKYLLNLNQQEMIDVLRKWFSQHSIHNISNDEYLHIIGFIKSDKSNEYLLNKDYSLFKDYEKLSLAPNHDFRYNYVFDKVEYNDFRHFKIMKSGSSFDGVTVSENDFPITIRNFRDGDKIKMRYGHKRVSRWFIDNKIAPSLRRSWPIVINSSNEVILVPKIGCNVTHFSNNPNMFVVK